MPSALFRFNPSLSAQCSNAALHLVASFQVKNNGDIPVIITSGPIPLPPVKVLPGETSIRFTAGAEYSIRSEIEHLPLPPPEVLVVFSPGGQLNAKAINAPSVNIDVIANFDFPKGDPVLTWHPTQTAHYL